MNYRKTPQPVRPVAIARALPLSARPATLAAACGLFFALISLALRALS